MRYQVVFACHSFKYKNEENEGHNDACHGEELEERSTNDRRETKGGEKHFKCKIPGRGKEGDLEYCISRTELVFILLHCAHDCRFFILTLDARDARQSMLTTRQPDWPGATLFLRKLCCIGVLGRGIEGAATFMPEMPDTCDFDDVLQVDEISGV
jgi:hypothetical protein